MLSSGPSLRSLLCCQCRARQSPSRNRLLRAEDRQLMAPQKVRAVSPMCRGAPDQTGSVSMSGKMGLRSSGLAASCPLPAPSRHNRSASCHSMLSPDAPRF